MSLDAAGEILFVSGLKENFGDPLDAAVAAFDVSTDPANPAHLDTLTRLHFEEDLNAFFVQHHLWPQIDNTMRQCGELVPHADRPAVDVFCVSGGFYVVAWNPLTGELEVADFGGAGGDDRFGNVLPYHPGWYWWRWTESRRQIAQSADGAHVYRASSESDRELSDAIHIFERASAFEFDSATPPGSSVGGGVAGDHGDGRNTATGVGANSDTQGDFTAGDVDYFRVVVDVPGTLEAYTSGRTDTLGKLEDADGSELSENDDGGSGTNFRISEDVSPGTYYVRVAGFNSRVAGAYTLHVRFTGSSTGTSPSFPAGSSPGDQTYTVGTAISALTLPEASGGDGPLTYSLTPTVPGLSFNATASVRRLTGTPTTAGTYNMTYTVRDVDGDTGSLTFAIAVEDTGSGAMERSVPLLLSASDSSREGVVRVINRSTVGGTVAIRATDDSGWQAPEISLAINAQQARHFNSSDLESGNPEKGLTGSAGPPVQGDWRLEWSSELDIEVLAFVRTADGFLAPMHDAVPRAVRRHRVSTFYPETTRVR